MLYVFHVDTGTMMTFDMNLAMESVSSLQAVIARGYRIPEDKQVLLVSGGESLDPSAIVGKYHAGTDTNPIFLFSKTTIEAATPPSPSVNYGSDIDLQGQVEGSLLMPPAYETVVSRAQLALQFQDVDSEELRACERLIHDQHLQQQGWAAVVANLEDVTSELQQRSSVFQEEYEQYLENRQSYSDTLASISESLQLLSKIPVLPCLAQSYSSVPKSRPSDNHQSSLFDWINAQDSNHSLHDMVEQCITATDQLDGAVGHALKSEVEAMSNDVHNGNMKEVKGLEDRLYGLDQIISGARKIVNEQSELAQGFVHNQNRLSNVRDKSILPDLCASHRSQLAQMVKNHGRIRDIKKKCRMAKEELSVNLHTRLRWVMYVEKKICDVDGKLTIYLGNLKRLSKRLDILQQVHDAPTVYAQLVIEVVRRKQFSDKFLTWATSLAGDSGQLHADEVKRREAFLMDIGHHFLQTMFQGFEDYPPTFASEVPSAFDQNLPRITVDDISLLKQTVPELSGILSVPVDEDLFHDIHLRKDSSVQWVEHSDTQLAEPTATATSLVTSDIDIISSEPHQLYSLEGGSISLGDQFTECDRDTEIVQRPDVGPLSPADKEEFLLPKSLSEELTLQMKRRSTEISSKVNVFDGKISDSQHTRVASVGKAAAAGRLRKHSSKSMADVPSPDLDASQEFTTADFYIDESMPSSMDSPPNKPGSERRPSSGQLLNVEREINEKLQAELRNSKHKATESDERIQHLKQVIDERLPQLQGIVNDMKYQYKSDSGQFIIEFDTLKQRIVDVLISFESNLSASNKELICVLEADSIKNEQAVNDRIAAEVAKCADLETKVRTCLCQIKELTESHNSAICELANEKNSVESSLKAEIKQLIQNHELEMEVEIDKASSDLIDIKNSLEKELEQQVSVIKNKDLTIEHMKKENIKLEETLLDRFQAEKEEICDILTAQLEEKSQNALQDQCDSHKVELEKLKEELKREHEIDLHNQLDALKQSLATEQEQAVEMAQSTLTLEHNQENEAIKLQIMEEKSAGIFHVREELELKFQEDLARFSTEFNREKEDLVSKLNKYTCRVYKESNVQTDVSFFHGNHCDTQTEPYVDRWDIEVQTESQNQLDTAAQTDIQKHVQLSIQTDILEQCTLSVQTDNVSLDQLSTQTDVTPLRNSSMQTDSLKLACCSEVSDCVDAGRQIDDQTDSPAHCKSATESEQMEQTQSDGQPKSLQEVMEEMQKEFDKKLAELEEQHNKEISDLISRLEKQRGDASQLRSSLTSLTGDKQVRFNEAVNKVSQEKDRMIEELRTREAELLTQADREQALLEQLREDKLKVEEMKDHTLARLEDRQREFDSAQQQLEASRQEAQQYREQLRRAGAMSESISTAPTGEYSDVQILDPEDMSLQQRIRDLQDVIKLKDEEMLRMQDKVMELSMSASTRSLVQDKVSITSCHVGDLVLLCLDERLDQYVVFTVGTTLHFLHTDCLTHLGLKTGDSRKQWLIAEVTDKEYCQAKKPNNRFKVPVGTKFYRVKAKHWARATGGSPAKKSLELPSTSGMSSASGSS